MPDHASMTRLLLKVLVSGALLALTFYFVPLKGVGDALRAAKWDIVAASVLVMLIAHYVKSIQMYLITRHQEMMLSPGKVLSINLATMFYGLFLPGVIAGGAVRWYLFSREDRKPAEALAAIVLNRVLETSMLVCLGLGFWLIDQRAAETVSFEVLLLLVSVSILVYLVSFSRRAHAVLLRCTDFGFIPDWVKSKSAKVLAALGRYEDMSRSGHLLLILVGTAHHLIGLVSFYMLSLALQLDVGIATLGWIRSIVAIAMFVPVTVAGLGIREVTFIALLVPYGVATNDALTLSILVFSRGLFFSLIGGLLEAKRVMFGRKEFAK